MWVYLITAVLLFSGEAASDAEPHLLSRAAMAFTSVDEAPGSAFLRCASRVFMCSVFAGRHDITPSIARVECIGIFYLCSHGA